jgi:hypothetical protein
MSGALNRPRFFVIATTPQLEPGEEGVFTQVNPQALISLQTPEVLAQLQRFCADLEIPYQQPAWYLVDSWTEETQEPTDIE